jgi:O-antigen biosynthesis protein WbqV
VETYNCTMIDIEQLLPRPSVSIDQDRAIEFCRGKTVMVTGGGGSIGSELGRLAFACAAARVIILENSEPALHAAMESYRGSRAVTGHMVDVRDRDRVVRVMTALTPDVVFHAAALKHVPILETDWEEGIKTNVFGSVNVADACVVAGVPAMVMISTDKATDPVSMLGITKRFAERYCQHLDLAGAHPTRLVSVRFGNVLASNGSVVPKFLAQIAAGGPVTVTHPDMVRYFMTVREACDLVVAAASHATRLPHAVGSTYVLDMGRPVRILELAEQMIQMSGKDVPITFTGVRPGERLGEILFTSDEPVVPSGIPGVLVAAPAVRPRHDFQDVLHQLRLAVAAGDRSAAEAAMGQATSRAVIDRARFTASL